MKRRFFGHLVLSTHLSQPIFTEANWIRQSANEKEKGNGCLLDGVDQKGFYIYIYICIYIYKIHLCVYMYICVYVCIYACVYVYVCKYIHTHTYI